MARIINEFSHLEKTIVLNSNNSVRFYYANTIYFLTKMDMKDQIFFHNYIQLNNDSILFRKYQQDKKRFSKKLNSFLIMF